jgi:hypothetical protein
MQNNVQIPYSLFINLIRFHLLDFYEDEKKIKTGLEQKLKAMSDRQLYSKYKTAESENEREKARQQYLDSRGVSEDYRW